MLKLQIIVGSTRPERNADAVLRWVAPIAQANGAFEVEILDLLDWKLPFFQETLATVGDFKNPTYSDPIVKRWNTKIKEADAYLFITPEYNHSFPGVLKNAIDSVFVSFGFRNKAVAFVGYSIGVAAGVRAVEQLNQVMLETEAVPIRTQTLIPFVMNAFDAEGKPANPILSAGLGIALEDLAWLAKALKTARTEGELPPPTVRMRAAMAKK
ncbi:MAG TPA: NAD(P)H-dependent oxidoreductase [bacterium]|nr:NAD(P)H-dependent oxidoreductase [bacterium]